MSLECFYSKLYDAEENLNLLHFTHLKVCGEIPQLNQVWFTIMLMGIELYIIYYTLICTLDCVDHFRIQIIWCTHLLEPYPIDIKCIWIFLWKIDWNMCIIKKINLLANWVAYITQLNDYWPPSRSTSLWGNPV